MKVINPSLFHLMQCIRTADLSWKGRLRFEIKRISKEEALHSDLKKDVDGPDGNPTEQTPKPKEGAEDKEPSAPADLLGILCLTLPPEMSHTDTFL